MDFSVAALAAALLYLLAAVLSAQIAKLIRISVVGELPRSYSSSTAFLLTFLGFASAVYL